MVVHVRRDTVSSLYNHIPNIINLSKKAKSYCPHTNTLKKYQLFDLKVKGQTEIAMEHDTLIIHGYDSGHHNT